MRKSLLGALGLHLALDFADDLSQRAKLRLGKSENDVAVLQAHTTFRASEAIDRQAVASF
jgi:hypothetical protein